MDSLEQKQKALYEEYSAKIKSADVVEATKLFRRYLAQSMQLEENFENLPEERKKFIIEASK